MPRKKPLLHTVTTAPEPETAGDSSALPPSQAAWGGHLQATRLALAMIYERATKGNGALSANEHTLASVCGLRCAVASGEWLGRLKANYLNELAVARFALNEMGAMSIAAYISDTVTALRRSSLVQQRDALLSKLERDLHAAGPALDTLIAQFAQGLMDGGSGSAEYLGTHSAPGGGNRTRGRRSAAPGARAARRMG